MIIIKEIISNYIQSTNNSFFVFQLNFCFGFVIFYNHSSIQVEGIRKFCLLGYFLTWGYLDFLGPKNQTRKINEVHKAFELYQVFICNFLWQTVLIFPIYILFTKRIENFWFGDINNARDIRTYCFKYFRVYILVHLYQK